VLYSFRYEAKNAQGDILSGEIRAVDLEAAKAKLKEHGLEILSIHVQLWKEPGARAAATVTSKNADDKKKTVAFKPPGWPGKEQQQVGFGLLAVGFLVMFGFILFPTLFGSKGGQSAINQNIEFKIVKFDDLSEGDVLRKDYSVLVPHGIKKEEVKYLAQKIFDQEKKKMPQLSQAMFRFYYSDQDYKKTEPVALLVWNWEESGAWENTFSLARETGKEKVQLNQVRLAKGDYVEYNATVSADISLEGVQRVAETELSRLEGQWKGKVQRIKLQVTYQNFSKPVMRCEKSLPEQGSSPAAVCDYVQ
jgi:hypothetical protein